jgi:FkbM family methyltransferase
VFDFSGISRDGVIGQFLRLPLALIPKGMVVRVLQGKLRGYRWITSSSTHGCWLGSYELTKQCQFSEVVKEGDVVFDIGANVGFYSLLASHCVGPTGQVQAFEPLPENLAYLEKHFRLNHCTNVSIHCVAVSDRSAKLCFQRGGGYRSIGRLSEQGDLEVKAISLDEFVYHDGNRPPNVVKIDVETAEFHVLRGAERLLKLGYSGNFMATKAESF